MEVYIISKTYAPLSLYCWSTTKSKLHIKDEIILFIRETFLNFKMLLIWVFNLWSSRYSANAITCFMKNLPQSNHNRKLLNLWFSKSKASIYSDNGRRKISISVIDTTTNYLKSSWVNSISKSSWLIDYFVRYCHNLEKVKAYEIICKGFELSNKS